MDFLKVPNENSDSILILGGKHGLLMKINSNLEYSVQ